ncbi:pyridoxal phosphate-dependent aminotransferase [Fuchsiella alkaliacetigena]|uniref:pyridoxal phosphate-dependent aminotransferase n=1 Tax=Fuchsiella alkaliacetigena TaxID=957042 RepID=UPI00200A72A2|nr:pyridoxal phosphate-dependent aminotransferase [Fuchsiella alkaliacetigena]MCK8825559.1 pyridoxal phosphate-dependent aminotransferase [Fuchsiella alkaliacetigena]
MYLTDRVKGIDTSPTLAITSKAQELSRKGVEIINLGAGEPDFNTPEHIKEAAIEAIKNNFTNYTTSSGIRELKEAICEKLKVENGVEYEIEEIIVSSGAKHSLYNTIQAICGSGDEVILPAPYWVSYPQQIKLAGGKTVVLETEEKNEFKLKAEDLAAQINDRTRALILNTPANPTGALYTEDELRSIAQVAVEKGIYIIADEIYENIYYDQKPVSISSFGPEIKELTILINGVSKCYSMTGWRIGYAAANKDLVAAMSRLQSHSTSNPNSIAQKASVVALTGEQKAVALMRNTFKERRDYIVERIKDINGLSSINPQGAFYLFVNATELIGSQIAGVKVNNDHQLVELLLTEAKVAVVPGSAFGFPGYLRLSYASSKEELTAALDSIAELLN